MSKNSVIVVGILILAVFSVYLMMHNSIKNSYAQDNNVLPKVVVECDKNALNPNENLTCHIKGKDFTYGVSSFSATVVLGDNFASSEYHFDNSIWQGAVDGGVIDLYTDINKTGDFEFASFTLEAANINSGANTTISLSSVSISNDLFEEISMSVESVDIRIKSNVNALSNLTVTPSNIVFNQSTKEYTDTIDENQVVITATRVDETSILTGDLGTQNLEYGINQFTVTVTSESGLLNKYTIVITRPDIITIADEITVDEINDVTYFSRISLGSTVSGISSKITTSGQINIYSSTGNKLTSNDIIGTGSRVSVTLSSETRNYIIVILGDTTGDGKITVTDVSKLFQHYRTTNIIPNTQMHYILAGDVSNDNEIKLTDVAKLFQYVRGKILSLD